MGDIYEHKISVSIAYGYLLIIYGPTCMYIDADGFITKDSPPDHTFSSDATDAGEIT